MNAIVTENEAKRLLSSSFLNRICALWMGCEVDLCKSHASNEKWSYWNGEWSPWPPRYSTDWRWAGELLEAMCATLECICNQQKATIPGIKPPDLWVCSISKFEVRVTAPTPQLAAARACAMLIAKGIDKRIVDY